MADFVSVLRRAVENLKDNNEAARHALYGKARTALLGQLKALDPPLGEEELQRQTAALDAAIAEVEAEFARAAAGLDTDLEAGYPANEPVAPPSMPQNPVPPPQPAKQRPVQEPRRPSEDLRSAVAAAERLGQASADAARRARTALDQAAPTGDALGGSSVDNGYRTQEPAGPHRPDQRPRETGERRTAAIYDDGDSGGGAGRYIAWIVLALVIVGIAGVVYWQRDTLASMVATLTGGSQSDEEQKIVDRVPGNEAPASEQPQPPAVQPPATTQPQIPPAAESEGERVAQALLIEEGSGTGAPITAGGLVDWRLADDTDATGAVSKVIEGQVRIPDKDLQLTLTIRRNLDQALPASHLVELVFTPGPNFRDGGIASVPGLLMKATPRSSGQPLVGAVVPVMEGYFLVGLSESELDRERNIAEMRTRGFIDIPINYSNGGRAVLSLAKGETGTKVFQDAFAAWGESPPAAPLPSE